MSSTILDKSQSAVVEGDKLTVQPTRVFFENMEADERVVVNQGSTGSSKTYSILQNEIREALDAKKGHLTSVVSATFPQLKKGALRDFENIMLAWGLYDEKAHHKTDQYYTFPSGAKMEFFSLDQAEKARGPRRNRLYINEANLIEHEMYRQLASRTYDKITIDYNPSHPEHWIYDELIGKEGVKLIISTYKDNPYLSKGEVDEIESQVPIYQLRDGDEVIDWDLAFTESGAKDSVLIGGNPNNWRVFGLGQRGLNEDAIYPHAIVVDEWKEPDGDVAYGMDFGYNAPSTLVRVWMDGDVMYVQELLYQTKLTTKDLIVETEKLMPNKNEYLYCDSAEPDRIDEFYRQGFNVYPADKSVKDGIDFCKSKAIRITSDSINLIKEKDSYFWKKDRLGIKLDEPKKGRDHALDAMRYAAFSHFRERKVGFF